MSVKYVKIKLDEMTALVLPQTVEVWEKHGWTVVEDGDESTVETTNPEKTEQVEVTPDLPVEVVETEPTEGDTEGEAQ